MPAPPRLVVTIPRGDRPMNEFTENARIITSSFVCAFPLGEGVVRSGSLSTTDARHLLLQWNPAISRCINLVFLLFNQRQRHGALQQVAAAVRNNNSAFREFQELVSNPDIGDHLDAAIASPNDAPSRALIQKLKRIMKIFNGMVPFTAAERKSKLGEFQAAMRMFGDPVFFNTLAPDSLAHVPAMRASFDMSSNTGFPAEDGGFLDLISSDVIGLPRNAATAAFAEAHGLSAVAVRPDSLLQRLLHDPIAMALAFEEDVLFQQRYLNGHPFATDKNRKTLTRAKLRELAGVFGVCSAAAGVVECNGTFAMVIMLCNGASCFL
jgi:hypothetical protein